ncbi:MAG: PEGA domain-containing protein [Acidobacteriota bacterium]
MSEQIELFEETPSPQLRFEELFANAPSSSAEASTSPDGEEADRVRSVSSFEPPLNAAQDEEALSDETIAELQRQIRRIREEVEDLVNGSDGEQSPSLAPSSDQTGSPEALQTHVSAEDVPGVGVHWMVDQARRCLESQDFESCMSLMNQALKQVPDHPEALVLLKRAQAGWEDHHLETEWKNHLVQVRAEAISQFERGEYSQCLSKFRTLCDAQPEDRILREFLEVCEEQVEKALHPPIVVASVQPDQEVTIEEEVSGSLTLPRSEVISESSTLAAEAEGGPEEKVEPPVEFLLEEKASDPDLSDLVRDETHSGPPEQPWAAPQAVPPTEEAEEEAPTKRSLAGNLAVAALTLLALGLGAWAGKWLALGPRAELASLSIQSAPPGAAVLIDGVQKGVTPLRLEAVASGKYYLQLSKQGYQSSGQEIDLVPGQALTLSLPLSALVVPVLPWEELKQQAQTLVDEGKLIEAVEACNQLLLSDPGNAFALSTKERIRAELLEQSQEAIRNKQWDSARQVLNRSLGLFPGDSEALGMLKMIRPKLKKPVPTIDAAEKERHANILALQQRITTAFESGNYFRPDGVVGLVRQLEEISPGDVIGRGTMDKIHRMIVDQAERKLQRKDFAGLKSEIRQLEDHFPSSPELVRISAAVRLEEGRQAATRSAWLQKAETAFLAGHYLSPSDDNVVVHANRVLSVDPQNSKALSLKKESLQKALDQARALVQAGKYDEGRDSYAALYYLSKSDSLVPAGSQQLKAEVDRLEFRAYPVSHDHTVGHCTGRLRFNAYTLVYLPSAGSKDGFSCKLTDVKAEAGEKLKIQANGKTYRYDLNNGGSKDARREKIREIQEEIGKLSIR